MPCRPRPPSRSTKVRTQKLCSFTAQDHVQPWFKDQVAAPLASRPGTRTRTWCVGREVNCFGLKYVPLMHEWCGAKGRVAFQIMLVNRTPVTVHCGCLVQAVYLVRACSEPELVDLGGGAVSG